MFNIVVEHCVIKVLMFGNKYIDFFHAFVNMIVLLVYVPYYIYTYYTICSLT
jgi:hypothetical protein